MIKMDIVFAVVGIVFLAVILTIVLPIAQEAWKANEHAKAVWWSLAVWIIVGVGVAATALPMAYNADREQANAVKVTSTPTETESDRNFRLANQQWLEMRNWTVRLQRRPEGFERLDISFELFNPTKMAVTLKRTTVDTTSLNPFVLIPMSDPEPQITSLVDTTTNEFIDTGISPGPQHIRIPLDRNPDPGVERYSGDPKRPFQSTLTNSAPTGSDVSSGPPRRRGETKLGGHVLAPNGADRLTGGWYDLDTPDKVAHYDTGRLRLSLHVTIEYVDAFDRPITRVFLMTAGMGRHSGHNFSQPTAIDHLPGKDVFGQPVKPEKRN